MFMIMDLNPNKKEVVTIIVIATSQRCMEQRSRSMLRHALPKLIIKRLPLNLNLNQVKMSLLVNLMLPFYLKITKGSTQPVSLLLLLIKTLHMAITMIMKS